MNEETRYIVDRIIDEGHMIGSHTSTHRNLQYGNQTVLEEEIVDAHNFFKDYLGFQPKIFRPPYVGIDDRSHKLLEEYGYSIVMWSSGCVDWWFTDNDKDLETQSDLDNKKVINMSNQDENKDTSTSETKKINI